MVRETAPDEASAESMVAARLRSPRGVDGIEVERVPVPSIGRGEALVRVHAAAITRDELEWPVDRLPAIPSYELSGVVVEVAPDVDTVAVGDAVYALTDFDRDGAAAELAVVDADVLAPKPAVLGHVESAAVPLAGLSAWQGLVEHGRLERGQRVLVHGATGGVGHFATQIARLRGAYVIATTSASSAEAARRLGADEVLPSSEAFEKVLGPVDLVFDTVGGEILRRSPAIVREGGRLVSVAEEPTVPAGAGIEALYFVVRPNRGQLAELGRLADRGDIRPAIDSVFALADARAAFARSMARGKSGKVVLRVVPDGE